MRHTETPAMLRPVGAWIPTDEQRAVIDSVTGPVRVLAGAGTGKTAVVTERIANQVRTGAFAARSILAVTFTRAAADEMRRRLIERGVNEPLADTFHATARWILAKWWPAWQGVEVPQHLEHGTWLLAHLESVPGEMIKSADTDIQWMKRQRAQPESCLEVLEATGHRTHLPASRIAQVFADYERAKRERNLIDFQDMLEYCIQLLEQHSPAADWFRDSFRAFTVDEYQDLDPLQDALLRLWVGASNEICVVGDPYQSIHGYAGASATYLEEFHLWQPMAVTYALTQNFRSSDRALAPANALAKDWSAPPRRLHGTPAGDPPVIRGFTNRKRSVAWVVQQIADLVAAGLDPTSIGVLCRWRSFAPYEEALSAKGIPHEVIGDKEFLSRPHIRRTVEAVAAAAFWEAALELVHHAASIELEGDGLIPAEAALERTQDIFALEDLVRECAETTALLPGGLPEWLQEKLGGEASGVRLMTIHGAKGLEFEAVFLPEVERGKLPSFFSTDHDEERRVLYVGLTRARRHLFVTWSEAEGRSPFVEELE